MVSVKKPPWRFWVAFLGVFMGTFTNYMYRVGFNLSVVSMARVKGSNETPPCLKEAQNKTIKPRPNYGTVFNWDPMDRQILISAYAIGYQVTVAPAGIISELLGPWHVILWTSVASIVVNATSPFTASVHYWLLWFFRFMMGFLGGFAYPAINVLIARWAPPGEKGRFLAAMMGNTLGVVVTFNVVGQVTSATRNWQWGFWALDFIQLTFCIFFGILVSSSPTNHRWISEEEKAYILEQQAGTVSTTKSIPPYKSIFTSIPFYALVFAQFGNLWGLNLILTYGPSFMSNTMGFNLKSSAFLAALPNLCRLILSQIFGYVGDWMRKKEFMSLSKLRKFFIIFSHFLPATFLFLMFSVGCNAKGAVPFLVLCQAFNGAVVVSHLVNPQDLAPNFAGSLYGIMNFIAQFTGFIVPNVSGPIAKQYDQHIEGAYIIFSIGAGFFIAGGILFILFGSAEVQPWNKKKKDAEAEEREQAK